MKYLNITALECLESKCHYGLHNEVRNDKVGHDLEPFSQEFNQEYYEKDLRHRHSQGYSVWVKHMDFLRVIGPIKKIL